MNVAAQVSLYPLRQAQPAPSIEEAIRVFRDQGVSVQPGPMSTVISGDEVAVFESLKAAFSRAASLGDVVMTVTLSNACPMSAVGRETRSREGS